MKNITFIISLFVILSVNTLLPMKRSADDSIESPSKPSHPRTELENLYIYNCPSQNYNNAFANQEDISITEQENFSETEEENLSDRHAITPVLPTVITYKFHNIRPMSAPLTTPCASNIPVNKFVCTFEGCNKPHVSNSALIIHTRTHTKEKPHKCTFEGCNKAYAQIGVLTRHMQTHTGETPFACTFEDCDKSFSHKNNLNKHLKTHSDEKYICTVEGCHQSFTRNDRLKSHMLKHTEKIPYAYILEG